jgi:uncharacterized protein
MRIRVQDIGEAVKDLAFEEPTSSLNLLLQRGPVHDYEFVGSASVTVSHYRAGQNVFLSGRAVSQAVGQCARCLESFQFSVDAPFSYVLAPRIAPKAELEAEDLDLSFYEGDEIDVSPLIREQVLLSLPTRPLCREDCRGLCPTCGANLNSGDCSCRGVARDPRLAVLRNLKVGS